MPLVAKHNTWLQDEAAAYPTGGQTRKGAALFPDGKVRRVWAGIPDTFFSIPAHARINGRYVAGWVGIDDGLVACPECHGIWPLDPPCPRASRKDDSQCTYGLVDSPTRGALLFHPNTQQQGVAA